MNEWKGKRAGVNVSMISHEGETRFLWEKMASRIIQKMDN